MTSRKLKVNHFYGEKTGTFEFIPKGITFRLLLHQVDGFKIEHEISVDDNLIVQWIHYNKRQCGCGSIKDMPLSQRIYNCPECDNIMDRDHNAAINILKRVGQGMPELTPVEMVT